MRLTSALAGMTFGMLAAIAVSHIAVAQETTTKQDPEQVQEQDPAAGTQNFGPRKKVQAGAQQKAPPAETVAKHGLWEVQCAALPPQQDGGTSPGKSCGMIQGVKSDKSENVGISVIVSKIKRGDQQTVVMRVMAPIGVYLPTGIPIEIDGAALPNRLSFTRCLPRVCEAFGEASPESLKKFMKGNDATFYVYDRPGNGFPLKISLTGFAKALAELDKQ